MALALFRKRQSVPAMADSPPAAIAASAAPALAPAAPAAEPSKDSARDILNLLELELGAMIRQLERAAASVATGAQSTAATLSAIRQRTDTLTDHTSTAQETAATFSQAADKFSHSADGINTQVREAGKLADQASDAAREAGANVDRLRESSAAIGNVVNLIATIAKQTTLLALITGRLRPWRGTVRVMADCAMLDQQVGLLDPACSIRDNFRRMNPQADENACRAALARFMFRADAALQVVSTLSGGQLLRAGLACVLGGSTPPALLILDEPTNHLDFDSIAAVEAGLRSYDGALVIVSHDEAFLRNIGASRRLKLSPHR